MSKEIVELKKMNRSYKVVKLTNRIIPEVGSYLDNPEVEDLIAEANRLTSTLTVKIS
jgi:hypothetical protein